MVSALTQARDQLVFLLSARNPVALSTELIPSRKVTSKLGDPATALTVLLSKKKFLPFLR
jgi:hypothetical protein